VTWRERYRPIIARVLAEVHAAGGDEKAEARALREAYPAAQRMGWAYKCWLDECARQRGKRAGRVRRATSPVVKAEAAEQSGQQSFEGDE
jgi:hypothetical protein